MKKFLFLILALTVTFSCAPRKEVTETDIPPGIIPPDSMVIVIAEMQYTEAILREYKRRGQYDEDRVVAFYDQTFDSLNITPEKYKRSLAFYEKNQETYYEIYKDVVSTLTKMQVEVSKEK
jgi:hypothetical protein